MLRRFGPVFVVIMFFGAVVLPAQDENPAEGGGENGGEKNFLFPIHIPSQMAAGGQVDWQPDWPANIPVDAFSILNDDVARRISALTLDGGGVSLTARRSAEGILTEFPVFLNGGFYQFSANLDSAGRIRGFTMDGENPLEIEFLAFENSGGEPSLARIHQGESWFFASIMHSDALILETWYDVDGNPLAVFTSQVFAGRAGWRPESYRSVLQVAPDPEGTGDTESEASSQPTAPAVSESRLYFDGAGNTTRIDADGHIFEALYSDNILSYWKKPDLGNVALQWDETGCLARMAGITQDDVPLDYRYQYRLDGRGAWTARLDVRMMLELGVLIPFPGDSFRRTIQYR